MPPVNVLIKPASSACDLRCEYCFYRDVSHNREAGFQGMLSLETMERVIAAAMEYAEHSCTFLFQGGEPTLAGLDFYRRVVELAPRYAKPGVKVSYGIQTNGVSLNGEWAEFFARHHFLVGLSLDGPADLHNRNRRDGAGRNTFNQVLRSAALLERFGVQFNILCVVTGASARAAQRLYRFYREHSFRFLQFIPCLEPLGQARGSSPCHLSAEEYGRFLVRIFDLWLEDFKRGEYVSIRHLDNWLQLLLGGPAEACSMTGRCAIQFVVEGDGGVYPCDFYVLDQLRLGTVGRESFAQMAGCETAQAFLQASWAVPEECSRCRYYPLCRNGCRRDRVLGPDGGVGQTDLCAAYRTFFDQRLSQLEQAAGYLANRDGAGRIR